MRGLVWSAVFVFSLAMGAGAFGAAPRAAAMQDGHDEKSDGGGRPAESRPAQPAARPQEQPKPQEQPRPQAQPRPQEQPRAQQQPKPQAQPRPQQQARPQEQPKPNENRQPQQAARPQPQPKPNENRGGGATGGAAGRESAGGRPQQNGGSQRTAQQQAHNQQQAHTYAAAKRVPEAQERTIFQQRRATNWGADHRDWRARGGYVGFHIPDARFGLYFGRAHYFHVWGLPMVYVGGYPEFQYQGYWFELLDPVPPDWAPDWFQTDEVYIDWDPDSGGYYLYDASHPGEALAVEISS
jgi:outer membrane biosynthesis protein TonB